MPIIEAIDLCKTYHTRQLDTPVLHEINLRVEQGQFLAIMGPSGCGKSTLLYVLGLMAGRHRGTSVGDFLRSVRILSPTACYDRGTVLVEGCDVARLSDAERSRLRRERMGFVFQRFNLLPALTAEENVEMSLRLRGLADGAAARQTLERVGLGEKRGRRPAALSIGEQQRVAIARALVARPAVLFADEPTGNLDSENGEKILALLAEFHRNLGQTILMVTHNAEAARWADRVIRMRDGRFVDG